MLGFLKLGEKLGFSYIKTYNAYKYAEKRKKMKRKKQEKEQRKLLSSEIKILLAGHPYNLYDNLIGNNVINFLEQNNITILFSNKIEEEKIEEEYKKNFTWHSLDI